MEEFIKKCPKVVSRMLFTIVIPYQLMSARVIREKTILFLPVSTFPSLFLHFEADQSGTASFFNK